MTAGMIGTALVKSIHHLSDQLRSRFRAAALHEIASPVPATIAVSEVVGVYHVRFAILAAPAVRLRFVVEIDRELDRAVLDRAAVETVRIAVQARSWRGGILDRLAAAAASAGDAFARAEAEGCGVTLLGVRLAPIRVDIAGQPLNLEIGYEGLDDQLRLTRVQVEADIAGTLAPTLAPALAKQALRARRLAEARRAGGIGLVDAVTLAAIRATEPRPAKFLRTFISGLHTMITVGRPFGEGASHALEWRDGVAGARLWIDRDLTFGQGTLTVRRSDRDLDLAALAGRPVGCLAEHPLLPADLVIESARWEDGWPWLRQGTDDHQLSVTYAERLHVLGADGEILT